MDIREVVARMQCCHRWAPGQAASTHARNHQQPRPLGKALTGLVVPVKLQLQPPSVAAQRRHPEPPEPQETPGHAVPCHPAAAAGGGVVAWASSVALEAAGQLHNLGKQERIIGREGFGLDVESQLLLPGRPLHCTACHRCAARSRAGRGAGAAVGPSG